MSGTRIRQKFAKKRSLHGVNEHFSQIFNAIIVPRSNRAKVSHHDAIVGSRQRESFPDPAGFQVKQFVQLIKFRQ